MGVLVLQIIITQWEKNQRTQKHIEERAQIAKQYPITFPPAFYAFDEQCVIDQHGDDILGDRLRYSQPNKDTIQIDRFRVSLSNKTLEYIGDIDSNSAARAIGTIDNHWTQCVYDWRYSVYEGGFYYWLYEEVTLNVIYVDALDDDIFISSELALTDRVRVGSIANN